MGVKIDDLVREWRENLEKQIAKSSDAAFKKKARSLTKKMQDHLDEIERIPSEEILEQARHLPERFEKMIEENPDNDEIKRIYENFKEKLKAAEDELADEIAEEEMMSRR